MSGSRSCRSARPSPRVTRFGTRTGNRCAARSMPTPPKVSMTESAAPSPASSITSVRTTPTCISMRLAFAGRNACCPDRQCVGRAGGGKLSSRFGPELHPRSNWQPCSDQQSGANRVGPLRAASTSNVPLLSWVDKGGVKSRSVLWPHPITGSDRGARVRGAGLSRDGYTRWIGARCDG